MRIVKGAILNSNGKNISILSKPFLKRFIIDHVRIGGGHGLAKIVGPFNVAGFVTHKSGYQGNRKNEIQSVFKNYMGDFGPHVRTRGQR